MTVLQPGLQASLPVKLLINIGCGFDIPTGRFVKGRYGESLLLGGLGALTGLVGHGNNWKSTLLNYHASMLLHRIDRSTGTSYDTEINMHEARISDLHGKHPEWDGIDPFEAGRWIITDTNNHWGGEYFDITKTFLQGKPKLPKEHQRVTPFINRQRNGYIVVPQPTFGIVDSLSEFKTEDVVKMQDDATLGDKDGNMIFMRQGIQKNRFLLEMPGLCGAGQHYLLMTAHIGDKFDMDPRNPSMQKLQHLRGNVKLKGVPEKFTFLMNNCWHAYGASVFNNKTTNAPEYPKDPSENTDAHSKDLNIVRLRQLRSKSGGTGIELEILVSQSDGVLPSLTEFHYVKGRGRYGLEGSDRSYSLALYPDAKLSRTTVRGMIDADEKLRRAINITSEMCQIEQYWQGYDEILCTPTELYNDLKALGYDWDVLLDTRGWWTMDNDQQSVPFLSTMDLLLMRLKQYVPYWMTKDQIPEAVKDVPRTKVF